MQTAHKQAGTREQHQRERDFADDQRMPQTMLRPAGSRAARTFLQSIVHVRARDDPRGHRAEDNAGKHGAEQGEDQYGSVGCEVQTRPIGDQQTASDKCIAS